MQYERLIASGRVDLTTYMIGKGQPVTFLHADICDSRMWADQMKAVGADAASIDYDRRGFGATSAEEDFSPVADLMAVIETVANGQRLILVGCSQGGKIALDAALRHPTYVGGLILIAPGVGGAPKPVYPPQIKEMLARQKAAEDAGNLDEVNAVKAHLMLDGPLGSEGRIIGRTRELFLNMNDIALRSPPSGSNLDTAPTFNRLELLPLASARSTNSNPLFLLAASRDQVTPPDRDLL